jgi:hypothetical protein
MKHAVVLGPIPENRLATCKTKISTTKPHQKAALESHLAPGGVKIRRRKLPKPRKAAANITHPTQTIAIPAITSMVQRRIVLVLLLDLQTLPQINASAAKA